MKKRVLITGISGFAGSYLAEFLNKSNQYEISGTYLDEKSLVNLNFMKDKVTLHQIDLLDKESLTDLIEKTKPDYIFHLAALSSPSYSFTDPLAVITNNINAQINLFETLRKSGLSETRVLVVSSADIYGDIAESKLPIDENTQLRPTSPYAVSKLSQDFLGLAYFLSYGMRIIRVRPFNHIGPRQSPGFVVSSIAKKIAEIEKNKIEPVLYVGNTKPKRDFTDVRDIVKAYGLIMERGMVGDVYNIGSDRSYKISDIINMMLALSGKKISVKTDPSLVRLGDPPNLICNSKKIRKITLWQPEIAIEKSLRDTLDYWRGIV
ncbi:GDP-mannose 4,6-dehydratase [Patescibacteria group bacterium]|nr:GDP-mannose 4,6-dehydratase [Patescibacteria group bacterium]MCL5010164.1 GDP-mannose 4,6-dehydratase [Patescibacteria group bacterium]